MSETQKILVGKIVAAQGLQGDVRVQTFTDTPEDFKKFKIESSKFKSEEFKFVRLLNPGSDVIIAKIKGFDDRDAAEKLRGTELFINRETLPQLPSGEYYQTDLIGMTVIVKGEERGKVDSVQNFGAGDILEMESGEMISFAGADVDIKNGTINL